MPIAVLTILKLGLLALLYLFVARAVRAVVSDLYGPSRKKPEPPPRPRVADPTASAPKPRKVPREIVVHPPQGEPQVISLSDASVTLGRGEAVTVALDDVYVSDEHAAVVPEDGRWLVRDLGSTNGTFLNGARVTQATPLSAGDQIRLGKTRVEVRR